ncbi:MAG: hypothetical protein WBC22_07260 [Sedimentisphaerales bacterium]
MINSKDVKRKSRRTKILVIVLSSLVVVVLIIFSMFGLAKILVRWYDSGTYYDYDSDKMVVYVEKKFNIDIPDSAGEIKAAKTGQTWDRWSGFILRFVVKPSEVSKFLETAVGNDLDPYNSKRDDRYHPYKSTPEWWTKPIKEGKIGYIYVKNTFVKDGTSEIYIYIDVTDEESNVVYLRGTYRSPIDR